MSVCPHCAHALPGHAVASSAATASSDAESLCCPTYELLRSGKVVLIGVGGPSASGKTTLNHHLGDRFAASEDNLFFMDRYFDRDKIYGELGGNWEVPDAVDEQVCPSSSVVPRRCV
jgi:hypothetical protein